MTERESRKSSQNQFGRRGNKAQTAKVRRVLLNYSLEYFRNIFNICEKKLSATEGHCEKEIIHYARPTCDNSEKGTENVM